MKTNVPLFYLQVRRMFSDIFPLHSYKRKLLRTSIITTVFVIFGFVIALMPHSVWLWSAVSLWIMWRYAARYYLKGSFMCVRCRRLKCRKHTGSILPEGIVCSTCMNKRANIERQLRHIHSSLDTLHEGFALRMGRRYPPYSQIHEDRDS